MILKIRFFEKVIEHFVLGVDSDFEQNDGFRRFRELGAKWLYVAAKMLDNFFKKSNFQKKMSLFFVIVVKLVTSVRARDA